jgi:type IV secretory pathway VirB2 component (pilin)
MERLQKNHTPANSVNSTRTRAAIRTGTLLVLILGLLWPMPVLAQQSPWGQAVEKLSLEFTGTIARGLSLVAIVVGGLVWSLDESGGSKRMLAGIVFGCGMALGAVQFMAWLFP